MNLSDEYVNMEIKIPRGSDGEIKSATVKRRALDVDGMPIGKEMLFQEIIDHRSNKDAITMDGNKPPHKTTKGWDLCVQWKGGQTT